MHLHLHRVAAYLVLLALVVPFAVEARGQQKRGVVGLDSFTYDKLLSAWLMGRSDRMALVRVDKEYSYGDEEDGWKAFAGVVGDHGTTGPTNGLLVVEVGVQEHGDKINQDLADRYQVTKDDYPQFFFFNTRSGLDNGVKFMGKVDKEGSSLLNFVQKEGGLDIGLPGTYKEFDEVVKGFASLDAAGMQKAVSLMKNRIGKSTTPEQMESGGIYLKLMERVLENGAPFLEKEEERLRKLLDSQTSEEKKEGFKTRLNIIPQLQSVEGDSDEL